jgi:uncharacterized membrane protein
MGFWSDTRANVSTLGCAAFALGSILAAFAIDAGSLYLERRTLQAAVDLAAITAAGSADPRATARLVLIDSGVWPQEPDEVSAAEAALVVEAGTYVADPALAPAARFTTAIAANAVRVRFSRPGRLYFANTWSPLPQLAATGIANVTPTALFSVGSRLARLDGGIGNAVLSALLGGSVSLSVMDYQALLAADVGLFETLDALALELGITAGSYDQLLAMDATHGQIARALARASGGVVGGILNRLGLGSTRVPLRRLVDLGRLGGLAIGSGDAALATELSVVDILAASAALANGSRQVELDLGAGLPGIAELDVSLQIGEPPVSGSWLAIGGVGTVARTAQLRLSITAELLGSGLLVGIRLPLHVQLASAEAQLTALTCPTAASPNGSAVVAARPGLAQLAVGDIPSGNLNQATRARILNLLLIRAYARAILEIAPPQPNSVSFASSEIGNGTVKRVSSGLPVAGPVVALLNTLQLDVDILGLGLGTPQSIRAALVALIVPLGPVLDGTVAALLEALGLKLGEADIRVHSVLCSRPVLVG